MNFMSSSLKTWPRAAYVVLHAASGVYAGACLCIALVDLPVLLSLGNGGQTLAALRVALSAMGKLMLPQLVLMLVLTATLAWRGRRRAPHGWAPFVLVLAVVGITASVHVPINHRILSGSVALDTVPALLDRWSNFHWLRTLLALAVPYCVIRFLRNASSRSTDATRERIDAGAAAAAIFR
jgi:MFS superfamily sulfate permease-like transporter